MSGIDAAFTGVLSRTYSLPFGFEATFTWTNYRLEVDWQPTVPRIRNAGGEKVVFRLQSCAPCFSRRTRLLTFKRYWARRLLPCRLSIRGAP